MPLAPMFVDPMLNPFRGMLGDVESRGLSGPDVETMRAELQRMEQLAQQLDDIAAYAGQLAQEQSFQKFSDAYGRALSNAARAAAAEGEPSDEAMLQNTLTAYESALASYRDGQAGEEAKRLIPHLERIVAIGRSGVSHPVFLRMMEQEGLVTVLDGAAPLQRAGLQQDLEFARRDWDRYRIDQAEQLLAAFERLAEQAPYGQPDPLQLSLIRRRVEWELAPLSHRQEAVVSRWQPIFALLVDWVDAFTSFAPWDARWRTPGSSEADVRRNIQRTQECEPGEVRFREALLQRYFRLPWDQIWTHETFIWEYTARRVEWSDERLYLMQDTYPHAVANTPPPAELVARVEALYPDWDLRSDRGKPPAWGAPMTGLPAR